MRLRGRGHLAARWRVTYPGAMCFSISRMKPNRMSLVARHVARGVIFARLLSPNGSGLHSDVGLYDKLAAKTAGNKTWERNHDAKGSRI